MRLTGKRVGFAMTGSFCNFETAFECLDEIIAEGASVTPIISYIVDTADTRFGSSREIKARLINTTGKEAISSIVEAEPVGPKKLLDVLIILPATGNTVAKLANGITDTPVLMAAKAQLRNGRPLVIALSSNDALSMGARNAGLLLNVKNIFFVPYGQDNAMDKPRSLTFKKELVIPTLLDALKGKQYQPLLL